MGPGSHWRWSESLTGDSTIMHSSTRTTHERLRSRSSLFAAAGAHIARTMQAPKRWRTSDARHRDFTEGAGGFDQVDRDRCPRSALHLPDPLLQSGASSSKDDPDPLPPFPRPGPRPRRPAGTSELVCPGSAIAHQGSRFDRPVLPCRNDPVQPPQRKAEIFLLQRRQGQFGTLGLDQSCPTKQPVPRLPPRLDPAGSGRPILAALPADEVTAAPRGDRSLRPDHQAPGSHERPSTPRRRADPQPGMDRPQDARQFGGQKVTAMHQRRPFHPGQEPSESQFT